MRHTNWGQNAGNSMTKIKRIEDTSMESLWRKEAENWKTELAGNYSAENDNHWDVIVIGAGLAGLLTAYYLKQEGKKVLVLEAKTIASGQTERTTAKITSQHGLKYSTLLKKVGKKKAKLYAQANEQAIEEYDRLIREKNISCEFERVPAYLYTLRDPQILEEEAKAASSLGIDAYFTEETELPFAVKGAVCFCHQARFSPLEFVKAIASELEILEHTKVVAVHGHKVITKVSAAQDHKVLTEDRVFLADKIVMASHYPIVNVPGFYFLRQHQERSYVLALAGCGRIEGMYYGIDQQGLSLRQAGEFLLLGGGGHRTGQHRKFRRAEIQKHEVAHGNNQQECGGGQTQSQHECKGSYRLLEEAARQYFPESREVARWSAQDCVPHDGIPFIGKYSVFTPHLYVATGFQKWGMTTSMVAAMILRDELCGRENAYAKIFSPQRMQVRAGMKNWLVDVGVSIKGLWNGLWHPSARCSHMGCELKWNPEEGSWDCACHGSRFDAEGHLLDNPAKKNLHKNERKNKYERNNKTII